MDNQNILAVVAGEEITQKDLDALIKIRRNRSFR